MQITEVSTRASRYNNSRCIALYRKQFGGSTRLYEDIRGKEENYGEVLKMTLALGQLTAKWTKARGTRRRPDADRRLPPPR